MKKYFGPTLLLLLLYVGFLGCLAVTLPRMPETVASHFDAAGNPNGWVSRANYGAFIAGFGVIFPLFIPAIFWSIRFAPASAINLPNRDYWLAPERATETHAFFMRHSLWFSCLLSALFTATHLMVVQANKSIPVRLSASMGIALMGFLGGVVIWIFVMIWHFNRPHSSKTN